jgi:hypothetical protein
MSSYEQIEQFAKLPTSIPTSTSSATTVISTLSSYSQTMQSQQYATTTPTTTVGTQVTTAFGQVTPGPIFSGSVTIPGTQGVCGVYFVQAFNAAAGQLLTGSVTASSTVDVYVMTSTVFQAWGQQVVAGGSCTPSSLVASQIGTTSYILSTTIPASGTYDLVVNNLSESTVTAQVNVNLAS